MGKILYITHTNPNSDARVLKIMQSGLKSGNECLAIGIKDRLQQPDSKYSYSATAISKKILNFYFKRNWKISVLNLPLNIIILIEIYLRILFRGLKFKPCIIHCHDWFMLPIAMLLKLICSSKLIYDAHELESECTGMSGLLKFIARTTESIIWPFIDVFITVSKSIESWYISTYGCKKSLVIYNSPQTNLYNFQKQSLDEFNLRNMLPIHKDSNIYLYSGLLTSGRGIDTILKSFLNVKSNSVVVFLGDGPFTETIKELSRKHANIFYIEKVLHDKVIQVAKSANFGLCLIENVCLSNYFSLPNKLFEYAFANLPIIASNLPEIKSMVTKYELGECINNNEVELIRIIEKNDLNQANSRKPFNENLIEFSWETQELILISLYNSILTKEF
jgi:glycosyltransferase involved in cell wall biosynthesis